MKGSKILDYEKEIKYMDNIKCKENGSLNNNFERLKDNNKR